MCSEALCGYESVLINLVDLIECGGGRDEGILEL